MDLPSLTDPEGAFQYLLAFIIVTAVGAGVVLYLGLGPY
jgi:hypothetical protein